MCLFAMDKTTGEQRYTFKEPGTQLQYPGNRPDPVSTSK